MPSYFTETVSKTLDHDVAFGENITINYPTDRNANDYEASGHVVTTSDGFSYPSDDSKISIYFAAEFVIVTNRTGFIWPSGLSVSVALKTKRVSGAVANNPSGLRANINPNRYITTTGSVTMTADDGTITINKSIASATSVSGPPTTYPNAEYTVVDGKGDASSNNITITFSDGNTYIIDVDHGSVTFWYDSNSGSWRTKCTNF